MFRCGRRMTRVGDLTPLSVTKVTQVATMVFETIEQRYLWSGGGGRAGGVEPVNDPVFVECNKA